MRRNVKRAIGVLALSAVVTACGSSTTDSASTEGKSAASGPKEAIKVALIPPSTGALAQFGSDSVKGWKVAVALVNAKGGVAGHQIELVELSTDATADSTLRAAREAVTQKGAKFIGSVMTSPEHGALNLQLESLGALSFNSLGKADDLIGKQCAANAFHVVQTNKMDINALGESLKDLPGQKWAIQAVDYVTGHDAAAVFKAAAKKAGKEVVLEQFAPLNTTDFGSYITKLQSSQADALFAVEYGADGVAFVKQAQQFNLPAKFKTVLGFNMVSEPLFPVLGDVVSGFYNNVGYNVALDNPSNKEFVAAYEKANGSKPYYVPADAYLAAQTLFAGIEKATNGDPIKVRDALKDLSFDSITGKVTVRGADHQVVRPSYVGKVEGTGTSKAFKIVASGDGPAITPPANPECKI
jgi:branched-chain amino acid transport system substrate-binding protein